MTREQLVVGRGTRQGEAQVDVVTVAVVDIEVTPVAQHVSGVAEGCGELEVVIRPAQTLTPSDACTDDRHRLVVVEHRVVVVIVVVVRADAVTVHRIVVIESVVTIEA